MLHTSVSWVQEKKIPNMFFISPCRININPTFTSKTYSMGLARQGFGGRCGFCEDWANFSRSSLFGPWWSPVRDLFLSLPWPKPFVLFSLPHPAEEGSDRVALLSTCRAARVKPTHLPFPESPVTILTVIISIFNLSPPRLYQQHIQGEVDLFQNKLSQREGCWVSP